MTEIPASTSVIVTNDQQPALENPPPKSSTGAPKWETAARERQIDHSVASQARNIPKSLARVLCSENVVTAIRKELKRTTGQSVTDPEIIRLLNETVLRSECLNGK